MLAITPSVQSPRAYDQQNLSAAQLGTRLAAGAGATMRGNLRTALEDGGSRYAITAAETAAGLTAADLVFGYEPEDVRRHGCVLDGVTDDTAAFQQALDAVPATGGTVYIPRGRMIVDGTIVWPADGTDLVPIRILGDAGHTVPFGSPQSVIEKTGTGNLFDLRNGTDAETTGQIALENLALIGVADTGVAIDAFNVQGSAFKNLAIGNFSTAVQIGGFCYYCHFDDVSVSNAKVSAWVIEGVLNNTKFHRCRVNTIDDDGPVSGVGVGWDISGGGVAVFDGCWLENVRTGVRLRDTQQAVFSKCYWESVVLGVTVDTDAVAIPHALDFSHCHFYHVHNGSSLVFNNDVADVYVSINDLATQQNDELSNTRIINKTGDDPFVHLGRVVAVLGDEVAVGFGIPWHYRPAWSGSTQSFFTFTNGDTTPDVSVFDARTFSTFNTGATTITAFDNGRVGQEIIVRFGDSNTLIDFSGTTLKGNGGVDWNPGTGDFMRCLFDGTNWLCQVTEI